MKKIRCIIKNYLKENPSCLKAGILTAAAIVCTAGLYAADNSESVKTNENESKNRGVRIRQRD